jgi:Kazal-type serine protease inhibitor domain
MMTTSGTGGSSTGDSGGGTDTDPGLVCTDDYDPVCGVDGETYDHPCSAIAAGVEIKRDGPCLGDCEGSCTVGGSPATLALALLAALVLRPRGRAMPPSGALEGASRGTRTPTPLGTGT